MVAPRELWLLKENIVDSDWDIEPHSDDAHLFSKFIEVLPPSAELEEMAKNYALNEGCIIERVPVFTVDRHLGNPQQYENVKRYNPEAAMAFKAGFHARDGAFNDLMLEVERLKGLLDEVNK